MTLSIYEASIPVFTQMLNSMSQVLAKAESHAIEKKIEPQALLQARLYPDMFPLIRQVQIAADFAKGVSARLANVDVPAYDDTENSFADLQSRIKKTLDFIESLNPTQFEHAAEREVVLRPGTPKEKKFTGSGYLPVNKTGTVETPISPAHNSTSNQDPHLCSPFSCR